MGRDKGKSAFDDVVSEENNDTNEAGDPPSDTKIPSKNEPNTPTESSNKTTTISDSEPAFPFKESEQQPMYPRKETWDKVSDQKFYTEAELRSEYGIRNVAKRELDEAILSLVPEEITPEDIAEQVVANRETND